MIEVSNLTKTYPGVVAVDSVSFSVRKGEIAGFLGPNGAGKTTTLRILTGFLAPTRGSATLAGFDVVRHSLQVRRRIGYLPESNALYTEMRVEEYLRFRAQVKGVAAAERPKRVDEALDRVKLADRRRSIIAHLSKGLRQRVGIADALVGNPEIVILDEPTIGLDPGQVREVREVIRSLAQERTVLFSSHILSEVEKVCSRVVILNRGKLVEEGTLEEIGARHRMTGRVTLALRGDGRVIKEAIDKVPGVARSIWEAKGDQHTYHVEAVDGADVRGALYRACAERNWELLELAPERLSLEEVFTILTRGDAA